MQVVVVHPLVKATALNKGALSAAIMSIQADSLTNLSGGLFKGMVEQLETSDHPDSISAEDWALVNTPGLEPAAMIKAVFLFTDGEANTGLVSLPDIQRAMNNLLAAHGACGKGSKRDTGATPERLPAQLKVHTFGFGEDHNPDLLQGIASTGNGTYYYIEAAENIPAAFADALGGLLSVYAQNVSLRITPLNGATIQELHTGLSKRTDGLDVIVTMPDLYAEERKDVVVDINLPPAVDADDAREFAIASATVRLMDIVRGDVLAKEVTISLRRAATVPAGLNPNEEIGMHQARLNAAACMREAINLADAGRRGDADSILRDQVTHIQQLLVIEGSESTAGEDAERDGGAIRAATLAALQQDLQRCRIEMQQPGAWEGSGKKYACSQATAYGQQRSNGIRHSTAPRDRASKAINKDPSSTPSRTALGGMAPPVPISGGFLARLGSRVTGRSLRGQQAAPELDRAATGPVASTGLDVMADSGDTVMQDTLFQHDEQTQNLYANRLQRRLVLESTAEGAGSAGGRSAQP
jgi:hypothetical protein